MRKVEFIDIPNLEKARLRKHNADTIFFSFNPSKEALIYFKNKKYFIRTYGCQSNIRDEETMSGILDKLGMIKTYNENEADVAILNTCAVRENAEDKVFGQIGDFKKIKEQNKKLILLICGCMIEQKHIIDKILSTFPYVDIMFGTHNIKDLVLLLSNYIDNNIRYVDVSSYEGDIIEDLPVKRLETYKAFVNITYGCNNFCSYCIVPYTRGKERSRSEEEILKECEELVKKGYKEITLLGQNVDAYGKDLKNGSTFARLLDKVASLNVPRVRFLTSYPSDFKDEVIDVIAKHSNIMKFIHLPVQSGSNSILKTMNRRYTREEYLELVNKIKNKIPSMEFSTDIIVGFPNESYEEFLDTVSLAREVHYTSAFTFIYSPRVGTPAAKMKDNVTYEEKVKRFKELVKELEIDFNFYAQRMVGNTYEVLVEEVSKKNKNLLSGYTENNKVVHFKGDKSLIGNIVKVKILENHLYSLIGEIVNE
ncbi:MAG: tRNA (N6-isopentenyl adenosine(37)-C2)-methylthiotransferase MiaB [Firmicutes bacterium]|uniref:tRNA-2-methylthio-N(6)-dimethylallyladenosine synthase n=1 Tax=Candidatus Onthovivens merdipullorum TaxID=2840889 RepID=A0A9D9DH15_9BACL|nr:tRNA (N6-isopentenyl adenosine(37)-C2)-methylthiotransferase MiaB [Candidatus Onthovivens merdipullorum]